MTGKRHRPFCRYTTYRACTIWHSADHASDVCSLIGAICWAPGETLARIAICNPNPAPAEAERWANMLDRAACRFGDDPNAWSCWLNMTVARYAFGRYVPGGGETLVTYPELIEAPEPDAVYRGAIALAHVKFNARALAWQE